MTLVYSKYKKIEYTPIEYKKPEVLIEDIKTIEAKLSQSIEDISNSIK